MDPIVLTTTGEPTAVLHTALTSLQGLGYGVTPDASGWGGRAEVGSAVGRVLLGGFSRRMIVDYSLSQGPAEGQWQLTLVPAMTGASGGALGLSKAKKEWAGIGATLGTALNTSGQLVYG